MGISLASGWLSGTLAAGTLGSDGGLGVSVGMGGRDLDIIYFNAMISRSCSSLMEKGDGGDGFSLAGRVGGGRTWDGEAM